jgi:hypothetical protein
MVLPRLLLALATLTLILAAVWDAMTVFDTVHLGRRGSAPAIYWTSVTALALALAPLAWGAMRLLRGFRNS